MWLYCFSNFPIETIFTDQQIMFFVLFCFFLILTGSHYVAVASLELNMYIRLALNLQRFTCFCLQSARVKSVCHNTLPYLHIIKWIYIYILQIVLIDSKVDISDRTSWWWGQSFLIIGKVNLIYFLDFESVLNQNWLRIELNQIIFEDSFTI